MKSIVEDSAEQIRSQIEILLMNRRGYVMRHSDITLEFFTKEDEQLYQWLIDQYNKAVGYKCYD